eukprot:gene22315-23437_t
MPGMIKRRTAPPTPVSEDAADAAADAAFVDVKQALDLTDHFLIAMPSMQDPIFGGTVVYLCEHNQNGALGVVINKPTDMTMDVLFDRINLKLEIIHDSPSAAPLVYRSQVMFGGPVQVERGFVLHTAQTQFSSTLQVTEGIALTTSKDVLEAVANGDGPSQVLVSLGCSGWSAGQLEGELARNGWLTVKADPAIIFDLPVEQRFTAALALLGIDPIMLSGDFAIGNTLIKQAQPLTIISAATNDAKFTELGKLI